MSRVQDRERIVVADVLVHALDERGVTTELARASASPLDHVFEPLAIEAGAYGQVEPKDAARGLLDRIEELTLETSGGFWHENGERLPW